jgi:hypothetical protein
LRASRRLEFATECCAKQRIRRYRYAFNALRCCILPGTTGRKICFSCSRTRPVETRERIVVGTKVPTDVELEAVPSDWGPSVTKYRYVYSGNRVMLVDPGTRTVVHEID